MRYFLYYGLLEDDVHELFRKRKVGKRVTLAEWYELLLGYEYVTGRQTKRVNVLKQSYESIKDVDKTLPPLSKDLVDDSWAMQRRLGTIGSDPSLLKYLFETNEMTKEVLFGKFETVGDFTGGKKPSALKKMLPKILNFGLFVHTIHAISMRTMMTPKEYAELHG